MPLPFLSGGQKKRDQVVAIDLGSRSTKAVSVQRKGETLVLSHYAVSDAPTYDRSISADILGEHLKGLLHSLGQKPKAAVLVLGPNETLLRHAEIPFMPVHEMRRMLKFSSKNYLQQDFAGHLFDCHMLPFRPVEGGEAGKGPTKAHVLVGAAKNDVVEVVKAAAKEASLHLDQITTALVAPANSFEHAAPEIFSKEVVALVDLGFKSTSISVLNSGELALNRVVSFGSAKLTAGIAESMGITNVEAENLKVGMPHEIADTLGPLLGPLGRELRASIDFFEHQQDTTVSQVFFCGGSSCCPQIVETLQTELMVPCKTWNPTENLNLALSPELMGGLEQVSPQLSVAIGAALGAF